MKHTFAGVEQPGVFVSLSRRRSPVQIRSPAQFDKLTASTKKCLIFNTLFLTMLAPSLSRGHPRQRSRAIKKQNPTHNLCVGLIFSSRTALPVFAVREFSRHTEQPSSGQDMFLNPPLSVDNILTLFMTKSRNETASQSEAVFSGKRRNNG